MPDMSLPQMPSEPPAAKAGRTPGAPAATPKDSQSDQEFSGVLEKRLKAGDSSQPVADTAGHDAGRRKGPSTAGDGSALPPAGNAVDALIAALDGEGEAGLTGAVPGDAGASAGTAGEVPTGDPMPATPLPAIAPGAGAPVSELAPQTRTQVPPFAGSAAAPLPPDSPASGVAQAVQDILRQSGDATADTSSAAPDAERLGAEIRLLAQAQSQAGGAASRSVGLEAAFDRTTPPPSQPVASTAAATPAPPDPAARPALPTTSIDLPLRQSGWEQALGDRVMWVVNQKFQGAEIKLNPPQLGPIEVRIQMHHDQAQVSFTTQHGAVREALESALPRLRDMFAANGLGLGDVNVSQHSFAEQQRHMYGSGDGKFRAGFGGRADEDDNAPMEQGISHAGLLTRSAIDLFA